MAEVLYYLDYEYNGPEHSLNKDFEINSSINLATNLKKRKVWSEVFIDFYVNIQNDFSNKL